MTKPVFIIGSGRCGTKTLTDLLAMMPGVEAHHEYLVPLTQMMAVMWYHRRANRDDTIGWLRHIYGSAIYHSQALVWADSSNKLSWISGLLAREFFDCKFIWLVRDGRAVTASYYYKLPDECYKDDDYGVLSKYIKQERTPYIPPIEKRYWWPIPKYDYYNRLERIAWHWGENNKECYNTLSKLPPTQNRWMQWRVEDFRDRDKLIELIDFLELAVEPTQEMVDFLASPHNVIVPKKYDLTDDQIRQFWEVPEAKEMMEKLGYE